MYNLINERVNIVDDTMIFVLKKLGICEKNKLLPPWVTKSLLLPR